MEIVLAAVVVVIVMFSSCSNYDSRPNRDFENLEQSHPDLDDAGGGELSEKTAGNLLMEWRLVFSRDSATKWELNCRYFWMDKNESLRNLCRSENSFLRE